MNINQQPIRTQHKTPKLPKEQENPGDRVMISFSLAFSWLKGWFEFSSPLADRKKSNVKCNLGFTLNT